MEIQAQPTVPMNTTNTGSSNALNGNSSNATAGATNPMTGQQAGGDFSATLNGIIAVAPGGNAATGQINLSGLNALVQLMASLNINTSVPQEHSVEGTVKQLDTLIDMLKSDSKDMDAILASPDVQAWLAGLQSFLLIQPQISRDATPVTTQDLKQTGTTVSDNQVTPSIGNSEALPVDSLNSLLFVPFSTTSAPSASSLEAATLSSNNQISKVEVQKLLQDFKQLLQTQSEKPTTPQAEKVFQSLMTDLQKALGPFVQAAAGTPSEVKVEKLSIKVPLLTAKPVTSSNLTHKGNSNDAPIQVVMTASNPKLEYLAAKSIQPKLAAQESSHEGPLFEPLLEPTLDATTNNPVIPMHEFLKQVESGQQLTKTPVVMMQAHNFVEDMTQIVIKSFTLDTKADGMTEAKLSLYPQHLGQVDVKLTMHNGQLVAQFMADSSLGREMLESQLSQLRTTLQGQGIQVQKLEVSQNQSLQSGMFQEQRQQQSHQPSKQQKANNSSNIVSLDEELAQEISQTASAQLGADRNSIDTTA